MDCGNTVVASVTAVALGLSEGKSADEINVLGSLFTQLGDTLATIANIKALNESNCKKAENEF